MPPATLSRLGRRGYREPPPPTIVFRCPVFVNVLAVQPAWSTLVPLPASPSVIVPALVKLTGTFAWLLLAGMVTTWAAPPPGLAPDPVRDVVPVQVKRPRTADVWS